MSSPTSDRIVDAAVTLFHRKGFNATSLREVADNVDLQVGSLYNHIDSKEGLLYRIMHDVMVSLISTIEERLAEVEDPVARLEAFFEASIRFHAAYRRQTFIGNSELRGLSGEHRQTIIELRDTYERIFRELLEAVDSLPDVDFGDLQLATFAGLALCTSVATWYRDDGRMELDDIVSQLPLLYGPLRQARTASGVSA